MIHLSLNTSAAKTAKLWKKLRRTTSILWLWFFYALHSMFAWVITCVLAFRPISTSQNGADTGNQHYSAFRLKETESLHVQNANWYRLPCVLRL